MKIQPIKTKIFNEGDSLVDFIFQYLPKLENNSVLVVTSKIVALAEGRTAIIRDTKTKEQLIKAESDLAIPTKLVWLTIKDNQVMAAAGIDESNANGKLILLPKNSFQSAAALRRTLKIKYKIKNLGILITDSRTAPLRAGVTGTALGYAGFAGLKDYRGQPDIFGRKFKYSQVNIADSLAAAAVLVMGEGREKQPLAVIEDAPVKFCKKIKAGELKIDFKDDMYRPFFKRL